MASVSAAAAKMQVPSLDLRRQFEPLRGEIESAVLTALEQGQFILGPNVAALEREVAGAFGAAEAVGVASGTDALLLSLSAAGVGPGDEVIVPAFSFVATADVVSLLGATPVFADIDPGTFCLDPRSARARVTPRTRAIVPVHLYGQTAEMDAVLALSQEHGLAVVEDCAQAAGARGAGVRGDFGCLSFFPSKNLGGCGDGGMILVASRERADKLRMLRSHGSRRKYVSEVQGWNSRLDELQAAILRVKLPHLARWNEARREAAGRYDALLRGMAGVAIPARRTGADHVFHQYTVRLRSRDRVQQQLAEAGVQTFVYYPVPLHLQPMYAHLGYKPGDLPHAEQAASEVLSLPMFPELRREEQEYVAEALRAALAAAGEA